MPAMKRWTVNLGHRLLLAAASDIGAVTAERVELTS